MGDLNLVKERYVKKHNAAIRSYSEMSLLQRKLANALLYNAYQDLVNKNIYEITISQLLLLLSMRTNDYKKLKQAIVQLMSTVIQWDVIKSQTPRSEKQEKNLFNSNENWKACTLLSAVQIEGTTIRYEYSQTLKDLFYRPSLYSKISLTVQNKFKSIYSLSLYENCMSYLNCGTSGWLSFEMFRKLMGVEESQYKVFRDFNRRVLKPAVLEINKTSDIFVNYEIRKTVRVPSHIKLFVQRNRLEHEKLVKQDDGNNLIDKLLKYGFSKKDAMSVMNQYGYDNVSEKLLLMDEKKTRIDCPIAFLKAALRYDYKRSNIKLINEKNSKNSYIEQKNTEWKKEMLQKEYKLYVDNAYKNWLINLETKSKEYLVERIKEYHESSNLPAWKRAKFKIDSQGWISDPDVFLSIKTFIISERNNKVFYLNFPEIKSFEDYSKDFGECKKGDGTKMDNVLQKK